MVEADILVEMSKNVYENPPQDIKDWKVVKDIDYDNDGHNDDIIINSTTGFAATAYQNSETGEVVIVYRGTDQEEFSDWENDIDICMDNIPSQYIEAEHFYNIISEHFSGKEISLTGHSLGGALAQLVGATTGAETVTFNSPGVVHLLDNIDPNLSQQPESYKNITNYNLANDILNITNIITDMKQLGNSIILPSNGMDPINAHNSFDDLKNINDLGQPFENWYQNNKKLCDILNSIGDNLSQTETIFRTISKLSNIGVLLGIGVGNLFSGENMLNKVFDIFHNAFSTPPIVIDPLLIDLDGDGIETTTIQNGVYFDHENDGFAESSSWVGEDDGILAFDKDNNGYIDDGNEIFGDNYIKSDGSKATSGFDALSDFDSNHDGVINSQDEKYSQLKILKGDGSLLTLEEAGIESINLNSTASNIVDASGNTQLTTGTYTKTDGTSGELGDYSLQNDKMDSVATDWVDIPADVQELPNIIGHGSVYSLQQAIVRDTSGELKELVESFINATDISSKRDLVVQILYKWTGADQIDPNSRGSNINAQQLYVLEKFMGENFVGVDGSGNPNNQACNLLNNAFAMLRDNIYAQLQSQTELKPVYDLLDLQYDSVSQKYVYNIDAVQKYIDSQIKIDATSGKELLTDFVQTFLALGLDDMSNYTSFYEHFASMGDDYKFLMETADKVITYGTDGSDNIEGTAQQEAVFAGSGNDTIYTRQGDDLVYGGNGDDYIDTCEDNDIIFGEDGNDTINTGSGDDVVYGGSGNDSIYNEFGNDYIDGGDGDDYIETRSGNDTIVGGRGNDSIYDNSGGNDTFIYNLGDGNDTIYNHGYSDSDTIQFGDGITPENVRFHGEDKDLVIAFEGSDGSIRVQNGLSSDTTKIENFTFEDGTAYTYEEVLSKLVTEGTSSPETLRGSVVGETIKGEAGDDIIDALEGNDTIYGGDGADTINTGSGDDVVYGGSGNDSIYNDFGNDYIDGGDGDDYIETRSGNDTIVGGRGNDSIYDNSGGNDTFIYNLGDGNDTIYNHGYNDSDTIQFGDTVALENIAFFTDSSGNLIIDYGEQSGNNTIKINNQNSSNYAIESFEAKDSSGTTHLLTNEDINKLIQDMSAYAAENGITISSVQDVKDNPDLMNLVNSAWVA